MKHQKRPTYGLSAIQIMSKFPNAWKTILRCGAAHRNELIDIIKLMKEPREQSRAWFLLLDSKPTNDELCYIIVRFSDFSGRALFQLLQQKPTAENWRYIIQWSPELKSKMLAVRYWVNQEVNADDLIFIDNHVPQIRSVTLRLLKQLRNKKKQFKKSDKLFVRGFGR